MVFVSDGFQVSGYSLLQGLGGLSHILFATLFALYHVHDKVGVTVGSAACVIRSLGDVASGLL